MDRYQTNATVPLFVLAADSSQVGVTGATVTLTLKRLSDGKFWTGAVFQAAAATVSMTEVDATNLPGVYRYDFVSRGLAADSYLWTATSSTATVVTDPWMDQFTVGGYVDALDATISSRTAVSDLSRFGLNQLADAVRKGFRFGK